MKDRFARPHARAALGFGVAALAQLLGTALAGAGHGWVAPLFLSVALWVLAPLALWLAWPVDKSRGSDRSALFGLAALAVGADAALIDLTIGEVDHLRFYVEVNGAMGLLIIGLWLCLWFGWQLLIFYALAARRP